MSKTNKIKFKDAKNNVFKKAKLRFMFSMLLNMSWFVFVIVWAIVNWDDPEVARTIWVIVISGFVVGLVNFAVWAAFISQNVKKFKEFKNSFSDWGNWSS